MERWRWMPEDLGGEHILVNIAGFDLRRVRDGEVEERMAVVVGKPYSRTPAFSDAIRYVELNPYWNVPPASRSRRSCRSSDRTPPRAPAPASRRSRGRGLSADGHQLEPVRPGNFPFQLRQRPGSEQRARPSQVHVPEPVQRLSARHACEEPVRAQRAGLQPRLHPPVAADRSRGAGAARHSRLGPRGASMRSSLPASALS